MASKLPEWLIFRWGRVVTEYKECTRSYPPFRSFMEFVTREANIACEPLLAGYASSSSEKKPQLNVHAQKFVPKNFKKSTSLMTGSGDSKETKSVSEDKSPNKPYHVCIFCNENHHLDTCKTFMAKKLGDRKQFMFNNELCFGCLRPGHRSSSCQNRLTCKTCSKLHATPLHGDLPSRHLPKDSNPSNNRQTV